MTKSVSRLVALGVSIVAFAATATAQPASAPGAGSAPAAAGSSAAPEGSAAASGPALSGISAQTGNPYLAVASVRMTNGYRAGKIIGSAVYNDQNQQVGTVDDLILDQDNRAVIAVLSVGGFVGIGGKLVAIPFEKLQIDHSRNRVVLPGANKDALNAMPSFTYSG